MRRTTDRIQALLRAVLLASLVIGGRVAPPTPAMPLRLRNADCACAGHGLAPGTGAYPPRRAGSHALAAPDTTGPATVSVRWTTPQGASRTGEIAGRADAAPGSLTAVWIDKAGQLTARPLSRTDVWERVLEAVAVTTAALILLLSAISWAASAVLNRYRLARWEAEWLAVEPQWTGRR